MSDTESDEVERGKLRKLHTIIMTSTTSKRKRRISDRY